MSISFRRMTTTDIALGMRLKEQAGWNQTAADWQRFLALEPEGCLVAEWEGRPVATTTTCALGSVGWIAMVLVDESFRGRGIATRLVERALDYLEGRRVTTVRLDATSAGQRVYERLGFVVETELVRFHGIATAAEQQLAAAGDNWRAEYLEGVVQLDRLATGSDRRRLIERLAHEQPGGMRLISDGGTVTGYAMLRGGSLATQIGPVIAISPETGRALCDWALRQCTGRAVMIDVPRQNLPAIDWARAAGLASQRTFARMRRGQPTGGNIALLWASSGPEKG